MEVACDRGHAGLHGDAVESHADHEDEMGGRNGDAETQTLNDSACSTVNAVLAEAVGQEKRGGWCALEEERAVHTPASSPMSGLIASDVTELGSVRIVEDLCLGTSVKKERFNETEVVEGDSDTTNDPMSSTGCGIPSPEDLTSNSKAQLAEPSRTPMQMNCSKPALVEDCPASQRGLSDFEALRAQLLSGKASGALQGSQDCRLCERSFGLQETLRLHQLLHRLDGVCGSCVGTVWMELPFRAGPLSVCGLQELWRAEAGTAQQGAPRGRRCADG
ncbi:hypothetical protein AAFF_G00190880 [Aldrovandia affinis]|uniref:C2H2-type domain-containing protein n=1 Tax=Aldrovandia affinis TaxID=143900 RepID=A0AAD7RJF2_9TELE|nr:hypothetical protein AAFF_G00190880 [Aldrovandia affinis]